MTKKLTGNGRWESSRFMLPEHISAIQELKVKQSKKVRPVLDEQRLQELSLVIGEAIHENSQLQIELFDVFENRLVTGVIDKVRPDIRQIRVSSGDDWEWVKLQDVVDIRVT